MLGYERETFAARDDDLGVGARQVDENGLTFTVHIEPHGEWTTDLDVVTPIGAVGNVRAAEVRAGRRARGRAWSATSSGGSRTRRALECDWDPLKATYRRSLVDLAALRFSPPVAGGGACRPPACPGS